MILDNNCFGSPSLWLWHKVFDGETIFANECGITIHGDIILGSTAFRAELSTEFMRRSYLLLYNAVIQLDPKILDALNAVVCETQFVMHALNTYPYTNGWMAEAPDDADLLLYFKRDFIRWYYKAPQVENMVSETIFLPNFDLADFYHPLGIKAQYQGMLLMQHLAK